MTTALREVVTGLDHAPLLGTWHNTDGAAGGVCRVVLAERRGQLWLRVFGAGRPEPHDWGTTRACGYAPGPNAETAWAFIATVDTGHRCMKVSGYVKSGLLVLTTYHAFPGAGWPVPYWTREFFHRDPTATAPEALAEPDRWDRADLADRADRATASLGPWQLDPAPLTGLWCNVDQAASRLGSVRIDERGGYLVLRPHGVWTPRRHDWHETVGCLFADDVRTGVAAAFTAYFELAVGRVEMTGYLERRLLTIETASTFEDGSGRSPFFVREHFYPSRGTDDEH